jgi:hypothetical protein
MINNPYSAEEWYTLRDDRSNRLLDTSLESCKTFRVGIKVNHQIQTSFSMQVLLIMTVNILSRWCRNVIIEMPQVKNLTKIGIQNLNAWLIELMKQNDPYGSFELGLVEKTSDEVLHVGPPENSTGNLLWADGYGYIAGINQGTIPSYSRVEDSSNLIGPTFGACLAVSELMHRCMQISRRERFSKWFSLYDLTSSEDNPNGLQSPSFPMKGELGKVHFIGNGAVGSSLVYLLGLTDWSGKIDLIDFDKVQVPNCSSSLLFSAEDAISGAKKVICGVKYLTKSNFICTGTMSGYSDFIQTSSESPDIILCLANEQNVWNTIQTKYPPIVFHATTTSSWGINMGRHIPLQEWCIMCRFEKEMHRAARTICSVSEISNSNGSEPVLGSLPFLAPASAVLLISELSRLILNNLNNKNFHQFSFKPSSGGIFLSELFTPRENCSGCSFQNKSIHKNMQKNTRFWHLSANH